MVALSVMLIVGIYVATLVQNVSYSAATHTVTVVVGAAVLAASLGLMAKAIL